MLTAIRTKTTSWVIKGFFVLLVASFAVWGIGDIFRTGVRERPVAEVGKVPISNAEFTRAYRQQLDQLESVFGGPVGAEQARAMGLPEQVLSDLVTDLLLEVHAEDAAIAISDEQVRRQIETDPAFRDQIGNFDRNLFALLLQRNRLSEGAYVDIVRGELARQHIINAVVAGAAPPKTLTATLYKYRYELRIAETLFVANDSIADVGTPDDAALQAYYDEHKDGYQSPEYRALSLVRLSPDDLAAEIRISDDDLRAEFESRKGEFDRPERREVQQIVVADEAAARAAAEKLAGGADFATVAQETTGAAPIDLGRVDRQGILAELADAAFGTPEGQSSQPVESPLGWHILKIVKVEPGKLADFEGIRDELAKEMAQRDAVDSLVSIANQFEDALAGGTALPDAAEALDLKVEKVGAVDSTGKAPDGTAVAGLDGDADLLTLVFDTAEGTMSPLSETADSVYVIVEVDSVMPAAAKPLDQVRAAVVADWQAAERSSRAKAQAAAIAERLRGGADLAVVAGELGVTAKTSKAITRSGADADANLSSELTAKLFALQPGEVATAEAVGGWTVARLSQIKPADPVADAKGVETVRAGLQRSLAGDSLAQFTESLRRRIAVSTDQDALDNLLGQ